MTEKVKERRPAVAALLSLVLMGLGQLYNGQLRRGQTAQEVRRGLKGLGIDSLYKKVEICRFWAG